MVRMLLSHNFDISSEIFPELSREEFIQIFKEGLSYNQNIACGLVNNPHWILELIFPPELSPSQVGEMCGQALLQKRLTQKNKDVPMADILILGGKKTTPATSSSPHSLQLGEWGVDVVETASGAQFLTSIGWETVIAGKPKDSIFKIELTNGE